MIKQWKNLELNQKRTLLLIELYSRKEGGFANWIFERAKDQEDLLDEVEVLIGYDKKYLLELKNNSVAKNDNDYLKKIKTIIERDGVQKFAFDFLTQNPYNLELLREIFEYLDINFEELKDIASRYVLGERYDVVASQNGKYSNVLRPYNFSLDHIYSANIYGQSFQIHNRIGFFDFLLMLNEEDAFEFIKNNIDGKLIFSEYDCISKWKKDLGEEEANRRAALIKEKLDIYRKQKNRNRANEITQRRQLSAGEIKLIEEFIDGNFTTLEEYFEFAKIDKIVFLALLDRAKDVSPELYSRYLSKSTILSTERFKKLLFGITQMADMVKNGIKLPDGKTRPFDILDYYGFCSADMEHVLSIVRDMKDMNPEIKRSFILFLKSNASSKDVSEKEIMQTMHSFNNPDGTIRTITEDEKKLAISYLKSNGFPFTLKVYSAVIRKYVSGVIIFDSAFQK